MQHFDKDAVRESLKPYMTNAEIDKAIADLMTRRKEEAPEPPVSFPPVSEGQVSLHAEITGQKMRIASAELGERIRKAYPTIPHGRASRDQRFRFASVPTARPCFRCGAARECGCAA